MQVQFNSDNQIEGSAGMAARAEEIARSRIGRIEQHLTRMEIYVGDIDGPRNEADDIQCAIEVRPAGMEPISRTHQAADVEAAVTGAADKVVAAYDRQIGKRTSRKGH